ncbi:hypothetical protein EMEDMD4_420082 [Sinorhizobium medicae]|uniref:Uncharacterized protein n=1 Tax=Sinorhizobium medicae TaxID=110321 RepID=A0A508X4A8_9HYPH|nr:hypothetical protein EMEDMD4_420082 [Sinorhizobium medicae]
MRTFLELLERDEEKSARFFASSGSIALESITFMFLGPPDLKHRDLRKAFTWTPDRSRSSRPRRSRAPAFHRGSRLSAPFFATRSSSGASRPIRFPGSRRSSSISGR